MKAKAAGQGGSATLQVSTRLAKKVKTLMDIIDDTFNLPQLIERLERDLVEAGTEAVETGNYARAYTLTKALLFFARQNQTLAGVPFETGAKTNENTRIYE